MFNSIIYLKRRGSGIVRAKRLEVFRPSLSSEFNFHFTFHPFGVVKVELLDVSGNVVWYKQQIDRFYKRLESVERLCATESQAAEQQVVVTESHHDALIFRPGSHEDHSDCGVPIGKFDGKVSWEAYRIQFEMLPDQNEWDERQRAVQLATSLKGPAVEVLSQFSVENRSRYSALVEVLLRKYGTMYEKEMYRARFRTRVRGRGETLHQFAQDLQSTVLKAYFTATPDLLALLKGQFIDPLASANLKMEVKQIQPSTMREALARALEFESYVRYSTRNIRVGWIPSKERENL
uniref:Retrotransposon gag domain-containing protein n=1 Tax=Octopus bimaculoides TaxID=37653 RepID=A0A0L8FI84_OCTBM